jgi:hypothetical protein
MKPSSQANQQWPMQRQTISSALTFWIKYVYPTLWIPGFGAGAFIVWFGLARGKHGELPPEAMKYTFAIIWLAGTTFILWLSIRIKRICIDASNLYVSKWFREFTIPMKEIAKVTEIRWINAHPVTIHFRDGTGCGGSVMFVPKRSLGLWRKHPIVAELRQLAAIASPID